MNGLSQKRYLELPLPTEDDPRSDQQRILDSLAAAGVEERVHIPVHILRQLYPLLDNAKWKITVSLAWNGENWEMVEIEEGDTTAQHYGLAVDLGSTTVVARLLDCNSGEILKEVSSFNKQIQWGTDILSRIFYCKDNKEKLEEVRRATVESICECMDKLDASHSALSMVIAGNHYDSLPSWNGRLLRFLHSTCSPRRSPRLPAGARSGHSAERLRLLLPCQVKLPWWRYYQRHD